MLEWALGLALAGSSVALHVEDTKGLSGDDVAGLLDGLAEAIGTRVGSPLSVEREASGACDRSELCLGDIRKRTGAEEVVLLRVVGGATRIRLVASRRDLDPGLPSSPGFVRGGERELQVDLERDRTTWPASFAGVAVALFPESGPPPAVEAAPAPRFDPASPAPALAKADVAPYVVLGGAAVALAAGAALGAYNLSLVNEGERARDPARVAELRDEVFATGLGANVLLSAAVVGALTFALMQSL